MLSKAKQHKTNEIGLYFFRHIWVRIFPLTNYCTVLKEGGLRNGHCNGQSIPGSRSVRTIEKAGGRHAVSLPDPARLPPSPLFRSSSPTESAGAIGCIYSKLVCNLIPKWLPLWCCVFSFKLLLVASFLNLRFKSTFSLERVNKS